MRKRLLFIVLLSLCVSACGETMKSSWDNFRAYYNTFYNAREHYSEGMKQVRQQPVVIHPDAGPVRVHPPPVQAGGEKFEQAILKAADVIQDHRDSKWVDDALLLSGKAHYYRGEFYLALRNFEELFGYSIHINMRERAVIWKGRTLLDMGRYGEAIEYVEGILERLPESEASPRQAEIKVLLAEHHAMVGNWQEASVWLSQALPGLGDDPLAGRVFFLHGQVLEQSGRYGESYYAFSQVDRHFPGFEYQYWSAFKRAEVARKDGNRDLALSIYNDLLADDKYIDRWEEISYQIARTYEEKRDVERALSYYTRLLGNHGSQSGDLRAAIYHRLGTIYGEHYEDYSLAAAYFDSSSVIAGQPLEEVGNGSRRLAETYGNFLDLQERAARVDSLLWLGSLSEAQLDSALEAIRLQQRSRLQRRQGAQTPETLANVTLPESNAPRGAGGRFGFLNHQNPDLVEQHRSGFRAVWGNRPLSDNWRRLEAVQQHVSRGESLQTAAQNLAEGQLAEPAFSREDIPASEAQRKELLTQRAALHYELGNSLLFSLGAPDKARAQFHRVLNQQHAQPDLRAKAMYSLYELSRMKNEADSLSHWEQQIVKLYPNSVYARQLRSVDAAADERIQMRAEEVREEFEAIRADRQPFKGARLRSLAVAEQDLEVAPYIYYKAIEDYISQAKVKIQLSRSFATGALLPAGTAPGDSLLDDAAPINNLLADLLLDETPPGDLLQDDTVPDDSLRVDGATQQDLNRAYFQHPCWDSVRVVLDEFEELFPESARSSRVGKLQAILQQPPS